VYTSSAGATSTASPTSHSVNHAGPIAGGVVASIAIVSIIAAAIFLRRRRSRAALSDRSTMIFDSFRPHMDEIQRPMSDGGTVGPSSMAPSFPYAQDALTPNRGETPFQGYTGVHSVDGPPPAPGSASSHVGSGTSLPQTRTYRGLPMPSI
jgi:hypothetical protein